VPAERGRLAGRCSPGSSSASRSASSLSSSTSMPSASPSAADAPSPDRPESASASASEPTQSQHLSTQVAALQDHAMTTHCTTLSLDPPYVGLAHPAHKLSGKEVPNIKRIAFRYPQSEGWHVGLPQSPAAPRNLPMCCLMPHSPQMPKVLRPAHEANASVDYAAWKSTTSIRKPHMHLEVQQCARAQCFVE
jgi:hypothetical protein